MPSSSLCGEITESEYLKRGVKYFTCTYVQDKVPGGVSRDLIYIFVGCPTFASVGSQCGVTQHVSLAYIRAAYR